MLVVIGFTNFQIEIQDDIKDRINCVLDEADDECFCKVYTDDKSTKEEVEQDCNNMIELVDKILSDPEKSKNLVDAHPKKANGTFKKNSVRVIYNATSTSVLWEESYCYSTYALRVKAISDTMLKLTLDYERNTW